MAVKEEKKASKSPSPAENKTPKGETGAGPVIGDLATGYLKKKGVYDNMVANLNKRIESGRVNLERIQNTIAGCQEKLSQLEAPRMAAELVDPLGKEMLKLLADADTYTVAGPVGESEAIILSFHPKGVTPEEKASGSKSKSITLITKLPDGGLGVRDYSKNTAKHAPGTIGYLNGDNHPTVRVPEGAKVSWLISWVK